MEVTKIDIKQELMCIPDGRGHIDFTEYPKDYMTVLAPDECHKITITRKRYYIVPVVQQFGKVKKLKNYLVNMDERCVFDDLFQITNATIQRLVDSRTLFLKAENDWMQIALPNKERSRIRSLPFWRRLFNLF